jgi:hypothetical protein
MTQSHRRSGSGAERQHKGANDYRVESYDSHLATKPRILALAELGNGAGPVDAYNPLIR